MGEVLTPQQQMAVVDRGGRLLVSAAAGSGKTKVLVDRLMGYLQDPIQPANIDDFLMITYTKAAAAELRGKIAAKLAEKIAANPTNRHLQRQQQRLYLTKISTVHAFCGDILREYAYRLDLSADFRVADEQECQRIRENVMEKVLQKAYDRASQDAYFCNFLDTQGVGRNDRQVPELVMQVYDSARCHLQPEKWLEHCLTQTQTEGIEDASQTLYGKFLMDNLRDWLQLQIDAMERCSLLCADIPKVHDLLKDTSLQLQQLQASTSWDEINRKRKIDFGRLVFPKTMDDEELKDQIKAVRDGCKKGLEKLTKAFADDSRQVISDLRGSAVAVRGLIGLVRAFAEAYDQAKASRRILDFSDLEHKMLDLLLGKSRTAPTAAAREIGGRFREVMVDEYQDSNAVQDAIYGALTNEKKNLFMVGDVKQSIYQFRLADPGIFLQKYNDFAPAESAVVGEDRKVLLSRNFRSSGGVLSACNDVFSMCMCPEVGGLHYGSDEALYEGVPHVTLPEPDVELCCIDVREHTYPEEAAYVASRIKSLLDGNHYVRHGEQVRSITPEDIVILLRSPGSAGGYFEKALSQLGIRYTTGGGFDLLKTDEIVSLRACLQAIYNPRVDIPLLAAMASPIFCFTANDLASIRSCQRTGEFLEALRLHDHEKSKKFLATLDILRITARRESLTALLEQLFRLTHLEDIYGAMENGVQRVENLQAFYQLASEFEASGTWDLGRFLEHLDAMEAKGILSTGEPSKDGCVSIMSIHKSKGLEFPVVFLCGLGREFNMESQRAPILCHKSMGLGLFAADSGKRIRYPTIAKRAIAAKIGQEALSEELRVLYVAMTRAKDRLIMTYASNRLQKDLQQMQRLLMTGGKTMIVRQAVCPGEWILVTALHKAEAGALFALGGRAEEIIASGYTWKIVVETAPNEETQILSEKKNEPLPVGWVDKIQGRLSFCYPHMAAVSAPSKMTATQRKGRIKDEEVAENTAPKMPIRQWRKPGFAKTQAIDIGNAIHAVMQYIRYDACGDIAGIESEIRRLEDQKFISKEQAKLVDSKKIAAFFATPLGEKLRSKEVVREFKFSILEEGNSYDPSLSGEQVLLQGVVDCALIEEDGITIIDFKTDRIAEENLCARVDAYRPQVNAYASAMQRIYQRPVKQTLLYFFQIEQFISL